ncbi:MAG: TetR/AcrR family transcriptional regulator [Spongiibacteraceae bacterium]
MPSDLLPPADIENSTPKLRRRQADRSALSDARMIDAAIYLLSRQGVDAVTLVAVGERAGYSRGLVTRRYGSKAGLLARVLEHLNDTAAASIRIAESEYCGLDMIRRLFEGLFASMRETPDEVRARHLLWFHSLEPATEFHATLERLHRVQRRQLENWLRAGQQAGNVRMDIAPVRVAEQLLALSSGLSYQWLVAPDMPLQAVASDLENTLVRWLAP